MCGQRSSQIYSSHECDIRKWSRLGRRVVNSAKKRKLIIVANYKSSFRGCDCTGIVSSTRPSCVPNENIHLHVVDLGPTPSLSDDPTVAPTQALIPGTHDRCTQPTPAASPATADCRERAMLCDWHGGFDSASEHPDYLLIMPSHFALGAISRRRPSSTRTLAPAPLFVCPGAKEVTLGHTGVPYGEGFSVMSRCPARDTCLWYAGHDLGGIDAFNEFPEATHLAARFSVGPFSCRDFKPFGGEIVKLRRPRRPVIHTPALVLLLRLFAAVARFVLHCVAPVRNGVGSSPAIRRAAPAARHPK